jgi:hypothetical protein
VNSWNISDWLEKEVQERDRACVYCRVQFASATGPRRCTATWEHIINDAKIITRDNIARCCFGCNSSKGTKTLADWLKSEYCKKRGITGDTVAEVVRRALNHPPTANGA